MRHQYPIIEYCSQVLLCLKTTAAAAAVPVPSLGQLPGIDGAPIEVVSQENENVLLGGVSHRLNDKTEDPEPAQNDTAVAIRITWPVNDTVFPVGDVMLVFERQGFPSKEIPIEVMRRQFCR